MGAISENDRKKIRAAGLAEKHNCDIRYVNQIISGEREVKSDLAKAIKADIDAIIILLTPKQSDNQ